jgi:hypothetical protein
MTWLAALGKYFPFGLHFIFCELTWLPPVIEEGVHKEQYTNAMDHDIEPQNDDYGDEACDDY